MTRTDWTFLELVGMLAIGVALGSMLLEFARNLVDHWRFRR